MCAYSLSCSIAIHARWKASVPIPADAPPRQTWIDVTRPVRPATRGSRESPESRRLRRASTRQSRHALPVQSASEGGRSLLEDKAVQEATLPSYAKSIATFKTSRDVLEPLRPRIPARARVGHGSHAAISNETQRTPVRSKRRTGPTTPSSSGMDETRAELRSASSSIGGVDGHGDRPPRHLETACAHDYGRLFRLPAAQRVAHATGHRSCISDWRGRLAPTLGTACARPNAQFPAKLWPSTKQ